MKGSELSQKMPRFALIWTTVFFFLFEVFSFFFFIKILPLAKTPLSHPIGEKGLKMAAFPAENLASAVATFAANSEDVIQASAGVLQKLLGNLVKDASNDKYRTVNTANEKIKGAVVDVPGAVEILLASGFTKAEDKLVVRIFDVESLAQRALNQLATLLTPAYHIAAELNADATVLCVAWEGDHVVAGSSDNMVRILSKNAPPRVLIGHESKFGTSGVMSVAHTSTGLVSGGRDGIIRWGDDAAPRARMTGHGNPSEHNTQIVQHVTEGADGTLLSCSWDKTCKIWRGEENVLTLSGHTIAVNGAAALSGNKVATASSDGTVRVWDSNGTSLAEGKGGVPQRGIAAVQEKGVSFVTAANTGLVFFWGDACQQINKVKVSEEHLVAIGYHRGLVFAGGFDAYVNILDLTGKKLLRLIHPDSVRALSVDVKGNLAVGCQDGVCRVWTRDASNAMSEEERSKYAANAKALLDAADAAEAAAEAAAMKQQAAAEAAEKAQQQASSGGKTYSFPVEVADGRKLTISWVAGEDPDEVAKYVTLEG